jgi:2-polyprenyl-3-methyl-5-hydroxy-6-metoxy-1,4-benzoquinol methylase
MEIARQLIKYYKPESILDYGSGDGAIFLTEDFKYDSASQICLYEPLLHTELKKQLSRIENSEKFEVTVILPNQKFDMVTCFEVLEHFQEKNLLNRLYEIRQLMKSSSILIISVPIETGISGFLKNCLRALLGQQHPNSSIFNVIKSLFGMPIRRMDQNGGYIDSHIGFNHNLLENEILNFGFKISEVQYSPSNLSILRFLSSQKFFVCKL